MTIDEAIFEIKKMTDEKLAAFSNFEKMTVMQSIGDIYSRLYSAENLAIYAKARFESMFPKKK